MRIFNRRIAINVIQCSFSTECSCWLSSVLISEVFLEYSRTWLLVNRVESSVNEVSIDRNEIREVYA